MGHPIVAALPRSDHAVVFKHDPRCDWPDCFNKVRWEVSPRRRLDSTEVVDGWFCTAHARAVIKRIERMVAKAAAIHPSHQGGESRE